MNVHQPKSGIQFSLHVILKRSCFYTTLDVGFDVIQTKHHDHHIYIEKDPVTHFYKNKYCIDECQFFYDV